MPVLTQIPKIVPKDNKEKYDAIEFAVSRLKKKQNDREAFEFLLKAYEGLFGKLVSSFYFKYKQVPYKEIEHILYVALLDQIKTFNENKGNFTSHLERGLPLKMIQALKVMVDRRTEMGMSSQVKVIQLHELENFIEGYQKKHKMLPSKEEMIKHMRSLKTNKGEIKYKQFSQNTLLDLLTALGLSFTHLDAPIAGRDKIKVVDTLVDTFADPAEKALRRDFRNDFKRFLKSIERKLTPDEIFVLNLMFFDEYSKTEIVREFKQHPEKFETDPRTGKPKYKWDANKLNYFLQVQLKKLIDRDKKFKDHIEEYYTRKAYNQMLIRFARYYANQNLFQSFIKVASDERIILNVMAKLKIA